jgi:hypothetical protein
VQGLAAHATHFVVFFALAGCGLLLAMSRTRSRLVVFGAGLCFGLALLMKQHGALFGVFGLAWLLWTELRPIPRAVGTRLLIYLAGLALPLVAVGVWVAAAGVWDAFWFWTFRYARAYVGLATLANCLHHLIGQLKYVTHGAVGFWLMALAGLGLLWRPGQPTERRLFLTGISAAAAIALSLGLVFRGHYFILLLPALALLAGAAAKSLFDILSARNGRALGAILPAALLLAASIHLAWTQRAPWFQLDSVRTCRWIYGLNPFPETREIGLFLREQAGPGDRVAVIGSEPQVYFYARRRSATGHIYMYPLTERHPMAARLAAEMIRQLASTPPEYLVLVFTDASWGGTPTLEMQFFRWVSEFSREHYQLIGVADLDSPPADESSAKKLPGVKTVWGAEAVAAYLAAAKPGAALPVCVLRRNSTVHGPAGSAAPSR